VKKRKLVRRNLIAKDLRTPKYRTRVVKPRKGKGAYVRRATTTEVE
jgi:stalled ribosome alternative rescue factor ArfA